MVKCPIDSTIALWAGGIVIILQLRKLGFRVTVWFRSHNLQMVMLGFGERLVLFWSLCLTLCVTKCICLGLCWWSSGWESACQCRAYGFDLWSGKIPHAAGQLGPGTSATEVQALAKEKPPQWDAHALSIESNLCRKPSCSNDNPAQTINEFLEYIII